MRIAAAALIAVAVAGLALPAAATEYPVTLGSGVTPLPIPAERNFLAIDNEAASGGNAIACAFNGGTPALNTAGSWTIPAGFTRTWKGPYIEGGTVNCTAAGSGTPVTVEAQ